MLLSFLMVCASSGTSEGDRPPGARSSASQWTLDVNRHTRESHIQRSFRTHSGTDGQLGGAAAGPARSSRRKSTLLAVPSLLDEKELHDEKEFLQQMRAGPLDRRFPLFVGLRCMLFHSRDPFLVAYALADPKNRVIVTTERSKPKAQRKNMKVPDVCAQFDIRPCNAFTFGRELGVPHRLARPPLTVVKGQAESDLRRLKNHWRQPTISERA